MKRPCPPCLLPWLAVAFCWLTTAQTHAHPVAQGALEVRIVPGAVEVRARVSTEEVFVASAFATDPAKGNSLDEVWKTHGDYLLNHLRLRANGQLLAGRVRAVVPPAASGSSAQDRVVYEFEFPLAPPGHPPARLQLEEDVLREFTYAPGNPWTASYVVRVEQPGRAAAVDGLLLDRNQPLDFVCAAANAPAFQPDAPAEISHGRIVREYVIHGLFHILTGYDHLLFMAALVLAAATWRDLLKVVSAFTLAHTLTLTLSVLDVVRLPTRIVEPMIAASIVFVALQNIFAPAHTRGWTRLATAFGFGLFHGLGFAGGLLEAMSGLPTVAIGTAIAAFSVGVELGHQAVVLPVFGALKIAERRSAQPAARQRVRLLAERYGSALISAAGVFYLVAALR